MNKKVFILLNVLILSVLSCKDEPKNNVDPNRPDNWQAGEFANPDVLAGYWIDLDFCARVGQYGSVLQAMNNSHLPFAFAYSFNPGNPDSVICSSATREWTLPVKYKKDTLELVGASNGRPIFLNYHSQGERDMTMYDNTSGRTQIDKFIKSKAGTKNGYLAFTTALNHHLFSGIFKLIGKGSKEDISFTPGGFIMGLPDYNRYEVCTGGDCFVAGQEIDVVTFYKAKEGKEASQKMFGYKYNGGNDTLSIYNMVENKSGEGGAYTTGSLAYKFSRTIPAPQVAQPMQKKEQ
ncbi:MAG: hypothetical protein R3A50_17615 [Saprospiraceae bacterium]|nr:hypothetical protein [Saprospiraceae bacterium]MCB9345499.1 hypothetical protein [Lewinellaceae bacterium]